MTRAHAGAVATAALCLAGGAFAIAVTSDHVERRVLSGVLYATTILGFTIAGLVATRRRPTNRTGPLMIAVGLTFSLGGLTGVDNAFLFTLGTLFASLPYALITLLALGYPTGEVRDRVDRALVAVALLLTTIGQVAFALVADAEQLCGEPATCPENLLDLTDAPWLTDAVTWTLNVLIAAAGAALVSRLAQRWRRASPALRRVLTPVYAATAVALVVVVWRIIVSDLAGSLPPLGFVLQILSLIAIPIAFLAGILRTRLARGDVALLLHRVEEGEPLRDALADVLDDPALEVAYWLAAGSSWIDAAGASVPPPATHPGRSVRLVERGGETIAALVHDPALDEEPELLDAIASAAGLSLRNEGLRAALRAQYLFLETITDTAPSLLMAVGLDGRVLNQNRAAVLAAGYDDQEEVRGRFFWDVFMDPWEREDVQRRFREAAPAFAPARYENTFVNRRGERRVIAWQSAPLLDDSGAVVSIIAGGTDITDRKARELELERERDATTTVLQSISSVIVVLARDLTIRDRDVDNPLAAVNRAFREGLGWRDEDLVHQSFLDFVAAADRDAARAALEVAVRGSASESIESSWLTADGREVVYEWSAAPVSDVTGRTDGLVLVAGTDVTERRRHEAEVHASRARIVRAADEARRRLERDLHDGAQQRLVSVAVSLRLAEARLHEDAEQAAAILAAARAELASALEELRELARGIHPAVLTDRGLRPAVEALVARAPIPVAAEVPELDLDPELEAAVYFVISESLANVAKYAGATHATVRATSADGSVTVTVSDDGVGGADPTVGSGLRGLADRVAALDGTLDVESPAGAGTCVRAVIPLPGAPPT